MGEARAEIQKISRAERIVNEVLIIFWNGNSRKADKQNQKMQMEFAM